MRAGFHRENKLFSAFMLIIQVPSTDCYNSTAGRVRDMERQEGSCFMGHKLGHTKIILSDMVN